MFGSTMPYLVLSLLLIAMGLFIWGKWRYDIISLIILMIATLIGAVPYKNVFSGLDNPAVITVACIMIISQSIIRTGILNIMMKKITPFTQNQTIHVLLFCIIIGFFSAFINNVGALAIMLPLAIQTSVTNNRSPSIILMPIAMASALGGMITLIGTPPNILISNFRHQYTGNYFNFFDFSFVGLPTAVVGIIFLGLLAWHLLPKTERETYIKKKYYAELKIYFKSKFIGEEIRSLKKSLPTNIKLLSLIRKNKKRKIKLDEKIGKGDIFALKAPISDIIDLANQSDFILQNQIKKTQKSKINENYMLLEAFVPGDSKLKGRIIANAKLPARFKIAILGITTVVKQKIKRLKNVTLQVGDMVLVESEKNISREELLSIGLFPITELNMEIASSFRIWLPAIFFIIAIILVTLGIFPPEIGFAGVVLFLALFKLLPIKDIYNHINWPIIILLAAMIPLGDALEKTGAAQIISNLLFGVSENIPIIYVIGLVLIITMTLSDLINNAATAVIMSPIAFNLAQSLQVKPDCLLMAVAIGASCAFLTPIGHQNNLLVMEPGKYKFFDYMRIGLPLEIMIALIATPLIYWFWYLH